MDLLPNELIIEIFNHIQKITDKRQFLKTCNTINNLTRESMCNYSEIHMDPYPKFHFKRYPKYSMEKFTLELCHDSYFNLIPEHYITPLNIVLVEALSYYNNVNLLEQCKQICCDLSSVIEFGALGGNIDVIIWGEKNNCSFVTWACAFAGKGGHLDTLKWLRNRGYHWDHWTCNYAATHNHLEIIKYAVANGCSMTTLTYGFAIESGNDEIINWLVEIGCPTY